MTLIDEKLYKWHHNIIHSFNFVLAKWEYQQLVCKCWTALVVFRDRAVGIRIFLFKREIFLKSAVVFSYQEKTSLNSFYNFITKLKKKKTKNTCRKMFKILIKKIVNSSEERIY